MGPAVVLRRWVAGVLAATGLALGGCEPRCQSIERTVPLQAPYTQFFNGLPACGSFPQRLVAASSSTGLTDSFIGSCQKGNDYSYVYPDDKPCDVVRAERRSITALSSLYGFNFGVEVEQRPDGPVLLLNDQSTGTGALHSKLTYHFGTGLATGSYIDPAASYTPVPFGQPPVVTELTNFQAGSRTYPQVWRVTNPLNASRSRETAVAVYYVARDYGLVRFDQRDGAVWTLML